MSEKRRDPGKISWDHKPNLRVRTPFYPLLSPKKSERLRLIVLSDWLTGAWTHYDPDARRTRPCTGLDDPDGSVQDLEGCIGCLNGHWVRWKGYLACWSVQASKQVLAELTEASIGTCPYLVTPQEPLRGKYLTIYRQRFARNGRVIAELQEGPQGYPLPPACDVQAALMRIWGVRPNTHRFVNE